jgi:hypothetical protein
MHCTAFVVALILALWVELGHAQSCQPAARPSNPAPVSQDLRVRIAGDFSLNEEKTRTTLLESGKSYWLSAAGCPRMGRIRMAVVDTDGKTVKVHEGHAPSFCFSPLKSGNYTVKITALTLNGSNSWGSIDAGLTASQCKN